MTDVDCAGPSGTVTRGPVGTGLTFQTLRFPGGVWQSDVRADTAPSLPEVAHVVPEGVRPQTLRTLGKKQEQKIMFILSQE